MRDWQVSFCQYCLRKSCAKAGRFPRFFKILMYKRQLAAPVLPHHRTYLIVSGGFSYLLQLKISGGEPDPESPGCSYLGAGPYFLSIPRLKFTVGGFGMVD